MDWSNPRSVETRVRRLKKEIAAIDDAFYGVSENEDRALYAGMLERKRDDIVRSAVLQVHTATENVLDSYIMRFILGIKPEERGRRMGSKSAQALRKMLFGSGSIGFDAKLNLAVALGLMNSGMQKKLMELNTLRNRCSHNWLLKAPVRHGRRPGQRKQPLLLFRGRDLHNVEVLTEFTGEYGTLYARLFAKYIS